MAVGSRFSRVGAAWLLFAGCVCACLSPVFGQSRLGAVDERGPLVPSAGAAADAEHRQRAELIAAQLLGKARSDLSAGRVQIAQRVLEQLIASFPETASAIDARRHLYALYANDARIWVPKQPADGRQAQVGEREITASAKTVLDAAPGAFAPSGVGASSWRTSIVTFKRLQEELRNGIGDRVFFSAGSADIGSRAKALLIAQAEWLLRRPEVEVVIEGHADDAMVGVNDEQMALARADAVRDRLVAEGVPASRIHVVAQGARDPVAVCSDSDCAAQNRRAIVQVGLRQSEQSNGR